MVAVLSDTERAISLEEMPPLVVIGEEHRKSWRKGPLAVLALIMASIGLWGVPRSEGPADPATLQMQTMNSGEQVGAIAAPWAFDADGNAVTTSYTIEGDVLIQTIEHLDSAVYPVLADPWFKPWTWSKKSKRFGRWAVVCGFTIGMAAPTVVGAAGSAAICIVTYP